MSAPAKEKRRFWTEADDALLRQCIANGVSRHDTAARLGRSESAVTNRRGQLGLRFDERLARARAAVAVKQRWQDPAYQRKVRLALSAAWTDERRQHQSAQAHDRQIWRNGLAALADGTEARERQRAAAAESAREIAARRLAWCPARYLGVYRHLTHKCSLSAAEARDMIEAQIRLDQAREQRTRADEMRRRAEAMRTGGGRARISAPLRESAL